MYVKKKRHKLVRLLPVVYPVISVNSYICHLVKLLIEGNQRSIYLCVYKRKSLDCLNHVLIYFQIWICFSPVTNYTTAYYNISDDQVNWLSLVYVVASIPFGLLATWLLDTLGLRTSVCTMHICFGEASIESATKMHVFVYSKDVCLPSLA